MKKRLDIFLVENNFFETREKAKANIMAGNVFVNNELVDKAGTMIKGDAKVVIKGNPIKYVSRGGLKLEKAIEKFDINLQNKICMDIGASTGGFTDCMLQNNAKKVYSIDVGYGQLDYKLRTDKRVISMERTNFRYIEKNKIIDKIDFASIDVSFISLKLIFPVLIQFLNKKYDVISLIKPQFEAGKEDADKYRGIIKDRKIFERVILNTIENAENHNMHIVDITFSPIKGQKGNIEFLAHFNNNKNNKVIDSDYINKIIDQAFLDL